jgi:hypothetical protein
MHAKVCNLHLKHFFSSEYLTKYKQNIFMTIRGEMSVVRLALKQYIVAYLLHARTVEPQKQPLLSNTRSQQ